MGQGYQWTCPKCGYSIEYNLGVGFMFVVETEKILHDIKIGRYGIRFANAANTLEDP